ncbi:MAG: tetratricopeptide repeat protein [Verrucomicrobia bacterium]|nr:MAG: tetratricopeptide repeat protein [Verrucomicrobiota bacterium]
MSWFKKKPEPPNPSTNRVEELANKLHQEGRSNEIESSLERLDYKGLTDRERESWHHLMGIEAMRRGDANLALKRFQDAMELFPDSQMIRFSLAQEQLNRGEIEKAFLNFDFCSFPKVPATWALAQARYAYLWNFPERGLTCIRPIFKAYFDLKIADDHFLYVRGLPFFSQTWNYLACFAWMKHDFSECEAITNESATKLTEHDFVGHKLVLNCFRNADFARLAEKLRSSIQEWSKQNWPTGFQNMQLAGLTADQERDFSVAEKSITDVQLNPNDFPWLEDVRTILLAKLTHKHERPDEEKYKQQFLQRQKLLFEPDHAVSFFLLEYQELLKQDYQKSKRPTPR